MRDLIPKMDKKVLVAIIARKLVTLDGFVPIARKKMLTKMAILLLPLILLILFDEDYGATHAFIGPGYESGGAMLYS